MPKLVLYGRECGSKEGDLHQTHPFPRVLGYKRGSDITKGDITKIKVYRIKCSDVLC